MNTCSFILNCWFLVAWRIRIFTAVPLLDRCGTLCALMDLHWSARKIGKQFAKLCAHSVLHCSPVCQARLLKNEVTVWQGCHKKETFLSSLSRLPEQHSKSACDNNAGRIADVTVNNPVKSGFMWTAMAWLFNHEKCVQTQHIFKIKS